MGYLSKLVFQCAGNHALLADDLPVVWPKDADAVRWRTAEKGYGMTDTTPEALDPDPAKPHSSLLSMLPAPVIPDFDEWLASANGHPYSMMPR